MGITIDDNGTVALLLVEDRVNRCSRVAEDFGHHNMLNVVFKEEPHFLETKRFRDGIGVTHRCEADFAVRDATDKRFKTSALSSRTAQRGRSIIRRNTGNAVPVPCARDVFVFVTFDIGVYCTVRQVETERLKIVSDS